MTTWDEMDFWSSGEWQAVQERLDDLDAKGIAYNPERENLFAALDACPLERCNVVIVGQDPYPDRKYATGVAFSIPKTALAFPRTLQNILKEYQDDLHYEIPTTGNLENWCKQGVLLWNAVPTCLDGKSLSHNSWSEWTNLTSEIIRKADEKEAVFAFLGGKVQTYAKEVKEGRCILLSHPSPRASRNNRSPFRGSRMFTSINSELSTLGKEPINWRL